MLFGQQYNDDYVPSHPSTGNISTMERNSSSLAENDTRFGKISISSSSNGTNGKVLKGCYREKRTTKRRKSKGGSGKNDDSVSAKSTNGSARYRSKRQIADDFPSEEIYHHSTSNEYYNYITFSANDAATHKTDEHIFVVDDALGGISMYDAVWNAMGFKKKELHLNSSNVKGKPICVTGVDGFVASWVVVELLSKGYHVRGTVQSRSDDISGILSVSNASTHFTVVEASLLTPESCDLAVDGCDFVIHTGTPTSCAVRDPLSEAQEPGVHSIGSRMHCIIPMMTNFIQACARAGVKKVVLSSSIAAMADHVDSSTMVNETCWNYDSTLEQNPHFLSLKLAEEAAWQLVDQMPKGAKFELVSVNVGATFGPVLCNRKKIPPGNQVIYDLISGHYSALVDLHWSMVDIRDCAKAHVLALENFSASGRYICVNRCIWMREIVDILSMNGFSGRDLPWKLGLPNWVARLPSYATQLGQVGASLYSDSPNSDKLSPYMNDKIIETLRIEFMCAKQTVIDVANDLLRCGLIKPWAEDHDAQECACCHIGFTFYRRKHHCRECGEIICDQCSQSRAAVDGLQEKARICDRCVVSSVPALLNLLREHDADGKRKGVIALESLLENVNNHVLVTRSGGIPLLMTSLHIGDTVVSEHAAGALHILSSNGASCLQMILEGAVLQMLEVDDTSSTWRFALPTLRNIWKQVNRQDFHQLLLAVARVSPETAIGSIRGNVLLTFVHMMELETVSSLLPEGLICVLYDMLKSETVYPRCAAAHAIAHLIPSAYAPDICIDVPSYQVDDHEELLTNSSLSDLQFLVKGHINPINAHKVVLFFRNAYFKNLFGSATSRKSTIEVNDCSYEVFSMLLRFLYTGKVVLEESSAPELLRAASTYQVLELQKRVEKYLAGVVNVDNVVSLLYLSDNCNAQDLRRVCITFLMKNIHTIASLASYEKHRAWASQEVLKSLASLLGREWEIYTNELIGQVQKESHPLQCYDSPQSMNIKHEQDSACPDLYHLELEEEKYPRLQHSWSDDLSEGAC